MATNRLIDYDEGLRGLFPGGYARPSMNVGERLPPLAVSGAGPWVTDEFGRRLFDLNGNFTANIHGHAHPDLTETARRVLDAGTSFGIPTVHELAHAEALLARLPGAERVKYAASGTEAVMTAVRIARAATGRAKVVMVRGAYHGTADLMVLSHGAKGARGVPASYAADLLFADLNDLDGLRAAVARAGGDLAAILLDLMPNYAGLVPLTPDFAAEARRAATAAGACLILDEVVNFRQAVGGLQSRFGIVPDLTVLGKLIGGGFAIGAVTGRAEVMGVLDPTARDGILHGGTFAANPLAMAAGVRAMALFDAAAVDRLNALGDRFRARLSAAAPPGWTVRGLGSLARILPAPGRPDAAAAAQALWWRMLEAGVLTAPSGLMALATPMTETELDEAADRIAAAAAGETA